MISASTRDEPAGVRQLCLFASHSLSRGHFFFALFPSQSPQIVISWLHGVNPSEPFVVVVFFVLLDLSILLTFAIYRQCERPALRDDYF